MNLILIITGVVLFIFGLYRTYCDSKEFNNINLKEGSLFLQDIKRNNHKLKEIIQQQYLSLQSMNSRMDKTIDELIEKERRLNREITKLKSIIIDTRNQNPERGEAFRDILDKNLVKEDEAEVPDKYLEVFRLREKGLNPVQIAEKMNIGIRETRLVFKLYGKEVNNVSD
ncbi:MAG: hypothetical protein ACOCQN_01370 [Halanaerobiaceae bacterium]